MVSGEKNILWCFPYLTERPLKSLENVLESNKNIKNLEISNRHFESSQEDFGDPVKGN